MLDKKKFKTTLKKIYPNQEIKYSGKDQKFYINNNKFSNSQQMKETEKTTGKKKFSRTLQKVAEALGIKDLAEKLKAEIVKEKNENLDFALEKLGSLTTEIIGNPSEAEATIERYKQMFIDKAKEEAVEMVDDVTEIIIEHAEEKIEESKGSFCRFLRRITKSKRSA